MVRVVGVRFKTAGKVYYFDPAEYPIAAGAKVVVETARGVEFGEVAVGPREVTEEQVVQPLKKVLRLGTEKDTTLAVENKRKENEAFGTAQKKIEAHGLEMSLVDVEYTFDGSKIIFYFTAEGRIDFRELVRDLASVFRTRIEMRQIGVRDEAKLLGGIGPCGRVLCCTSFLGDFAPVSIRMAKDQNLSLNPSKISGLCGRLMCCLRYEQDTYEAAKKDPTLAPGYVPPVLLEATAQELVDLEDRPGGRPGFREADEPSGFSARIAQAAGIGERPVVREERSAERPASERREQGRPGVGRPQSGPRPVGDLRPPGENRRTRGGQQAGGQKQQPRPQPQQDQPRKSGGPSVWPDQSARVISLAQPGSPAPVQGGSPAEERAEGGGHRRHRHHRGRRHSGDGPGNSEGGNPGSDTTPQP